MATDLGSDQAIPWETLLGQRIRGLREKRGMTQEELAVGMSQRWGLPWTRPVVTAIEAGRRSVTGLEMLAVSDVLQVNFYLLIPKTEPGDRPVRVQTSDQGDWVVINEIRNLGAGEDPPGLLESASRSVPETRQTQPALDAMRDAMRERSHELEGLIQQAGIQGRRQRVEAALVIGATSSGEAERKVARKLGISPELVAGLSYRLWGEGLTAHREQLLTEELERRTGETTARTIQALRGHITRRLVEELGEILKEAGQ